MSVHSRLVVKIYGIKLKDTRFKYRREIRREVLVPDQLSDGIPYLDMIRKRALAKLEAENSVSLPQKQFLLLISDNIFIKELRVLIERHFNEFYTDFEYPIRVLLLREDATDADLLDGFRVWDILEPNGAVCAYCESTVVGSEQKEIGDYDVDNSSVEAGPYPTPVSTPNAQYEHGDYSAQSEKARKSSSKKKHRKEDEALNIEEKEISSESHREEKSAADSTRRKKKRKHRDRQEENHGHIDGDPESANEVVKGVVPKNDSTGMHNIDEQAELSATMNPGPLVMERQEPVCLTSRTFATAIGSPSLLVDDRLTEQLLQISAQKPSSSINNNEKGIPTIEIPRSASSDDDEISAVPFIPMIRSKSVTTFPLKFQSLSGTDNSSSSDSEPETETVVVIKQPVPVEPVTLTKLAEEFRQSYGASPAPLTEPKEKSSRRRTRKRQSNEPENKSIHTTGK